MLHRVSIFIATSSIAYVALGAIFGAYCYLVGHSLMESLYGGFSTFTLAIAFGVLNAWLNFGR